MATYDQTASNSMGSEVSASAQYSEATTKRLIEDIVFLLQKAIETTNELEKTRLSRIAVSLVPYYLESLSNYLYYEFNKEETDKYDNSTDIPKPIRMLKYVYKKALDKDLTDEDISGIRDIFTIRNKITAHPAGRSDLVSTNNGWEREDKNIHYFKLKGLPKVYSDFNIEHVKQVLKEVSNFISQYLSSIKKQLSNKQYAYIWPEELNKYLSE